MNLKDNEIIEDLYKEFKRAEEINQEVKVLTDKKFIYGIDALKDVGWYLVKWNIYKQKEDLYEAKGQAKQAIYEAAQSGVVFYLEQIENFREKYGKYINNNIIFRYSEKMSEVNEIKEKYTNAMKNKKSSHNECYDAFQGLKRIYNEFKAVEPELNEQKKQQENKLKKMAFIISSVILNAAAVATIILACN
jgi:hypothetical protein